MNSPSLSLTSAELVTALAAVRAAAAVCQSIRASFSPDSLAKSDRSPVTIADFGSQAVVCRELSHTFPHDPIIAEEDSAILQNEEHAPFLHRIHEEICRQCIEASPDQICHWIDRGNASEFSDRFWTLDPIDGTKGFLRGGQYAIALALIVNGQIELGVLGCPQLPWQSDDTESTGGLFYAVRGQGAYALPLVGDAEPQQIFVNQSANPQIGRFCESVESGHSAQDTAALLASKLGISRSPLRMDSQAKYATVARGEADLYLRLPTRADYREMIWDHAGGAILVEEAGGRVTDVDGHPLDFRKGRQLLANRGVVASSGHYHDAVIATLQEIGV